MIERPWWSGTRQFFWSRSCRKWVWLGNQKCLSLMKSQPLQERKTRSNGLGVQPHQPQWRRRRQKLQLRNTQVLFQSPSLHEACHGPRLWISSCWFWPKASDLPDLSRGKKKNLISPFSSADLRPVLHDFGIKSGTFASLVLEAIKGTMNGQPKPWKALYRARRKRN